MKYDRAWAVENTAHNPNTEFLFFWGHRAKPGGVSKSCLSQWWESRFEFEGEVYRSAEHWMMAQKATLFGDTDSFTAILKAESPDRAKGLGRRVRGFDNAIWDANKYEIVLKGSVLKFSQNEALRSFLLATGNKILVEASPMDLVWGVGLQQDDERARIPSEWPGENLLGFALMEARDQIANA